MSCVCDTIIFSNKAYNAIIRESFDKDPVETGGILLGHVHNNIWIVMDVLPPGINCLFEYAYFEYDDAFVNYLAQSVANQYEVPLDLLGLWHRHPGSMDTFSSIDDKTNATFASQSNYGAISGLVNIDPNFRLTMYHVKKTDRGGNRFGRPEYSKIECHVGDDLIPKEYFRLKYFNGDGDDLNPSVLRSNRPINEIASSRPTNDCGQNIKEEILPSSEQDKPMSTIKKNKQLFLILFFVFILLMVFKSGEYMGKEKKIEEFSLDSARFHSSIQKEESQKPDSCCAPDSLSSDTIKMIVCRLLESDISLRKGQSIKFSYKDEAEKNIDVTWVSDNDSVVSIDNGKIRAKKEGETKVVMECDDLKVKLQIRVLGVKK